MTLYDLTIHEAAGMLRRGEISSVELTQAALDRILDVDNDVRAYLTLTPEAALEQAREADFRLAAFRNGAGEEPSPVLGVPVAVKDIFCTEGIPTTCGSRILEDFVPPYDATVVARLRQAGAVLLGKTNMDEFAMGSSNENSAFFPTHNPWDLDRVPGGSSGGSAAAVAAGEAVFALGTDTGGSVRLPAAFCGVVGLKPSYGRVSRYGMVAFASSLDQAGTLTRDVTDSALALAAIAGHDRRDSTSVDAPVPDYVAGLESGVRGLRLGIPREYFVAGMQPGVESAVRRAVDVLAGLGAEIEEVRLPNTAHGLPVYYLIAPAEASANLARYDGVKYGLSAPDADSLWDAYLTARGRGFGAEVKRRIMLGTYALSAGYYDAYYLKAQKVRTLIKADFDTAFERCDALLAPVCPTVAFRLGERTADPLTMYLSDVCTLGVNLAGVCGLSVPCGLSEGLPVGLQIIGKAFDEAMVLRVGRAYEQAAGGAGRPPLGRRAAGRYPETQSMGLGGQ